MTPRRSLSTRDRARVFAAHDGICHICGAKIDGTRERWDIEHVVPLALGGADDDANRKPAHYVCHKPKTADDIGRVAKAKRNEARHIGAKAPSRHPLPGGRNSPWRKKLDGSVVPR